MTLADGTPAALQAELDLRPEPCVAFDEDGEAIMANTAASLALGLPAGAVPRASAALPVDALRAGWQVRGEFELVVAGRPTLVGLTSRGELAEGVFVMALEPADGLPRGGRRFERDGRHPYEAAFEHAPAALLVLDDERCVIAASATARRLLGLARTDLGHIRLDGLSADRPAANLGPLWERLTRDGELAATLALRTSAGSRTLAVYVRANAVPGRHVAVITRQRPAAGDATRRTVAGRLSAREREILAGLAGGERTEQIAARLVLSADTVRTHVRNAMRKLEARSRVHAVVMALREREIDL